MFNHQPHRQEDRVQNTNSHLPKFPVLVTPTKEELSQKTSQEHSPNRSMKPLIDWHQFLPTIEELNGQCQESQGSFQMPHQDVEGLIIVNRFNQIQWMSHAAQRIFQSHINQLIGNEFFGNLVEPISQSNLDSKSLLFFLETVAYSQVTYCQTVKVLYKNLERVPPQHSVNLWQLRLLPSEWENERVYEVTLSPFPIHLPLYPTPPQRFISPRIPAPADDQGILVVDLDQKVIAYNHILCEVWNLPKPASELAKNQIFSEIFSRLQTPENSFINLNILIGILISRVKMNCC
jgi:hypothetical protein